MLHLQNFIREGDQKKQWEVRVKPGASTKKLGVFPQKISDGENFQDRMNTKLIIYIIYIKIYLQSMDLFCTATQEVICLHIHEHFT